MAESGTIGEQPNRRDILFRPEIQAVKLSYDKTVDIAYIDLDTEEKSAYSDEIAPGFVVDFSDNGRVVGLEIQHAGESYPGIFSFESISP